MKLSLIEDRKCIIGFACVSTMLAALLVTSPGSAAEPHDAAGADGKAIAATLNANAASEAGVVRDRDAAVRAFRAAVSRWHWPALWWSRLGSWVKVSTPDESKAAAKSWVAPSTRETVAATRQKPLRVMPLPAHREEQKTPVDRPETKAPSPHVGVTEQPTVVDHGDELVKVEPTRHPHQVRLAERRTRQPVTSVASEEQQPTHFSATKTSTPPKPDAPAADASSADAQPDPASATTPAADPNAQAGRIEPVRVARPRQVSDAAIHQPIIKPPPPALISSAPVATLAQTQEEASTPSPAPPWDVVPPSEAATAATSPATPADDAFADITAVPRQHLVAFYNIGFSANNPADRMVGRSLKKVKWKGFVRGEMVPLLDWGVRRIELHNPFGADPGVGMVLDQYLAAKEAGLDWLTDDFVEAWKPVTRGDYTHGEPVEVIAYVGHGYGGEFKRLLEADDLKGYRARAVDSVRPLVAAGMSIGFDSAAVAGADHPFYRFIRDLRDTAHVRVYIEPWPQRSSEHWHSFNVITAERFFQLAQVHPAVAPRSSMTGEIIRLQAHPPIDRPPNDSTWLLRGLVDALAAGDSVAGHMGGLSRQMTMEELAHLAEAAAASEGTSYD